MKTWPPWGMLSSWEQRMLHMSLGCLLNLEQCWTPGLIPSNPWALRDNRPGLRIAQLPLRGNLDRGTPRPGPAVQFLFRGNLEWGELHPGPALQFLRRGNLGKESRRPGSAVSGATDNGPGMLGRVPEFWPGTPEGDLGHRWGQAPLVTMDPRTREQPQSRTVVMDFRVGRQLQPIMAVKSGQIGCASTPTGFGLHRGSHWSPPSHPSPGGRGCNKLLRPRGAPPDSFSGQAPLEGGCRGCIPVKSIRWRTSIGTTLRPTCAIRAWPL